MRRLGILLFVICLLSSGLFAQTDLSVSPASFDFFLNAGVNTPQTGIAQLINTGGQVSYSITSSAPWLSASPSSGSIPANGSVQISVKANPAGIEAGDYTATLTITAPGRPTRNIVVGLHVQGIQLTVNPNSWMLTLAPNKTSTMSFTFGQVGGSGSDISISSDKNWLKINKSSGQAPVTVVATVDSTGLGAGVNFTSITATSGAAPAIPKIVSVVLTVGSPQPNIEVSPASFNFFGSAGSAGDSGSSTVTNTGPQVSITASSNQPWLLVSFQNQFSTATSAVAGADGTLTLNIQARATNLEAGTYDGTITVTAPNRPTRIITAHFVVSGVTISLNPSSLTLNAAPNGTATASFTPVAVNVASALVSVSNPTVSWLSISPPPVPNADRQTGQAITVTATATGLLSGTTYTTSLTVSGQPSGPSLPKTLPITLIVGQPAALSANPNLISINSGAIPATVSIQSSGAPITFDATTNRTWLTVSPQHATTPATLTVLVNSSQYDPAVPASVTITPVSAGIDPITVAVQLASPITQHRYSISQVADGGVYQTTIILVNPGSTAITASVNLYRSEASHATLTWNPAMVGNAPTQNVIIAPKTSYTLQTAKLDQANTISGWAEVTSTGPISGFAVFQQKIGADQEAAVPINVDGTNRFYLPYDNLAGFTTSMALVNLSKTDTANVNVTFRGSSNPSRAVQLGTIPPLGHWPFNLVEQFAFLAGDRGVAEFTATGGQLSTLGLRFNASRAFTSFEAQYPTSTGAQRYSIPQIADGGAYQTSIIIVNNGPSTAAVNLRFYRSDATHATQPWQVPLVGNAATQSVQIAPGASYTVQTTGSDPNTVSGWAEVVSSTPIGGFAIFRQRIGSSDQEAAVPINLNGSQQLLLPYDNGQGFTTSLALVNLSATEPAPVTATFRGSNGQVRTETLGALPPLGHWPFNLVQQFGFLAGTHGVAEFSTPTGQLSILGLRFNPSQSFTSFRAIETQP